MELLLDTHSVILPWRESWRRRLMKFVRRAARESCDTNNVDNNEELKRTRRVQRLRLETDYYGLNNPLGQQSRIKSPSMSYQPEKMRSSTKILSNVRRIKQPSASNLHNSGDANVYYPSDKDASHHAAYQNIFSSFYSNQ
ncbi:unnamed protein product [Trichobilharzia szidati]|nr:unnamed protein product [Trichobilharzia szidati]